MSMQQHGIKWHVSMQESANQYRLKNSIRKAEQMFAEEIAETLG